MLFDRVHRVHVLVFDIVRIFRNINGLHLKPDIPLDLVDVLFYPSEVSKAAAR